MPPDDHPLAQTLRRGHGRTYAGCHLGAPTAAPGWTPVAALRDDEAALARCLDGVGRDVGSPRRDVQASLLLEAYSWQLVLPLAGARVAEARVAVLGPDDTALDLRGGGRPRAVAVRPGPFVVLARDPAAGHPDARVVTGSAALDACLRDALVTHLDPLLEALTKASGRPRRALWRTVADRTATSLLYAGAATGLADRARRSAERVLGDEPPLRYPPRYAADGGASLLHLRHGCCLWWRTAAATTCRTCPLTTRARRPHPDGASGDPRAAREGRHRALRAELLERRDDAAR